MMMMMMMMMMIWWWWWWWWRRRRRRRRRPSSSSSSSSSPPPPPPPRQNFYFYSMTPVLSFYITSHHHHEIVTMAIAIISCWNMLILYDDYRFISSILIFYCYNFRRTAKVMFKSLLLGLFLQFRQYVHLMVCAFVCGSVCNRHDNSRTGWTTITKLDSNIYPCCGGVGILFGVDGVIFDKSTFWTAITPSIFELEHRSNAHNVENDILGYFAGISIFRYISKK